MIRFGHYPLWPRPPSRLARPNGQARLSTKLPTHGHICQKSSTCVFWPVFSTCIHRLETALLCSTLF